MDKSLPKDSELRLNKYVAISLGVSRRQADELIERGKITINGQTAQLGARINKSDTVKCSGQTITPKDKAYLIFNKPVGYVCSRRRQGETPTIYELLPDKFHQLKPVGRLDKDSSGLIILTNDGDFAYRMTHPSFKKPKRYLVTLDQPLEPLHRQMISDFGVDLPDGRSQLTLSRQNDTDESRWVVEMSEGRNRQIRRTFSALGYTVTKLHRTNFGDYSLGDIKRGEHKILNIS
ncbi:ribosomal large subunit pseudouridine synthase B [Candidatus Saccharibacteria bacterium 32-49-12]|nr:MAG: ribosomal large subunit pseudouridine synthase B [Candidatus Saccharibacteria bacterium 32-49-12]